MVYAVCFKQGEHTLPVYYEYGGDCFSDDLARAFARAEEAGENCLLSELPESYLSEAGITYLKPAARIEMNYGLRLRGRILPRRIWRLPTAPPGRLYRS